MAQLIFCVFRLIFIFAGEEGFQRIQQILKKVVGTLEMKALRPSDRPLRFTFRVLLIILQKLGMLKKDVAEQAIVSVPSSCNIRLDLKLEQKKLLLSFLSQTHFAHKRFLYRTLSFKATNVLIKKKK